MSKEVVKAQTNGSVLVSSGGFFWGRTKRQKSLAGYCCTLYGEVNQSGMTSSIDGQKKCAERILDGLLTGDVGVVDADLVFAALVKLCGDQSSAKLEGDGSEAVAGDFTESSGLDTGGTAVKDAEPVMLLSDRVRLNFFLCLAENTRLQDGLLLRLYEDREAEKRCREYGYEFSNIAVSAYSQLDEFSDCPRGDKSATVKRDGVIDIEVKPVTHKARNVAINKASKLLQKIFAQPKTAELLFNFKHYARFIDRFSAESLLQFALKNTVAASYILNIPKLRAKVLPLLHRDALSVYKLVARSAGCNGFPDTFCSIITGLSGNTHFYGLLNSRAISGTVPATPVKAGSETAEYREAAIKAMRRHFSREKYDPRNKVNAELGSYLQKNRHVVVALCYNERWGTSILNTLKGLINIHSQPVAFIMFFANSNKKNLQQLKETIDNNLYDIFTQIGANLKANDSCGISTTEERLRLQIFFSQDVARVNTYCNACSAAATAAGATNSLDKFLELISLCADPVEFVGFLAKAKNETICKFIRDNIGKIVLHLQQTLVTTHSASNVQKRMNRLMRTKVSGESLLETLRKKVRAKVAEIPEPQAKVPEQAELSEQHQVLQLLELPEFMQLIINDYIRGKLNLDAKTCYDLLRKCKNEPYYQTLRFIMASDDNLWEKIQKNKGKPGCDSTILSEDKDYFAARKVLAQGMTKDTFKNSPLKNQIAALIAARPNKWLPQIIPQVRFARLRRFLGGCFARELNSKVAEFFAGSSIPILQNKSFISGDVYRDGLFFDRRIPEGGKLIDLRNALFGSHKELLDIVLAQLPPETRSDVENGVEDVSLRSCPSSPARQAFNPLRL